jgi:hypothetical protein
MFFQIQPLRFSALSDPKCKFANSKILNYKMTWVVRAPSSQLQRSSQNLEKGSVLVFSNPYSHSREMLSPLHGPNFLFIGHAIKIFTQESTKPVSVPVFKSLGQTES